MSTIFGSRCAAALYEVGFSQDAVVRSLISQLGLTVAEATQAAREVEDRPAESEPLRVDA